MLIKQKRSLNIYYHLWVSSSPLKTILPSYQWRSKLTYHIKNSQYWLMWCDWYTWFSLRVHKSIYYGEIVISQYIFQFGLHVSKSNMSFSILITRMHIFDGFYNICFLYCIHSDYVYCNIIYACWNYHLLKIYVIYLIFNEFYKSFSC